jgi:uncharacterized protein YaaR (DUF327 family)
MIELTPTTPNKDEKKKIKSKKKTYPIKPKDKSFSASLEKTILFEFHGTVEELMEDLKEQEKNFLERQTPYELNKYKSIVQKILKTILTDGFKTEKLKRSRGDRADFIIVQDINKRLLEISKHITDNSNKAFNLLKKIDEIRGLILDLLH